MFNRFVKRNCHFLIIFITSLLYLLSLKQFFHSDDWFFLRITQINSLSEFIKFFSFIPNEHTGSFYRPVTQVYFFVLQTLFGFYAPAYHLFGILIFALSLYLIYRFSLYVFNQDKTTSNLALLIYALSATHFTQVFFISAFQETLMVIFILLSMLTYFRQIKFLEKHHLLWSVLFFSFALASKETAVVTPFLIILIDILKNKKINPRISWSVLVLIVYLFARINFFGFHHTTNSQTTYQLNLSPKKALNTIMWYGLWSLGAPELLVDYVGSGFKILPRLFRDYKQTAKPLLGLVLLNIVSLGLVSLSNLFNQVDKTKRLRLAVLGSGLFFIGILPLIPFPAHKFTLELTLPLIGLALTLATLLKYAPKYLRVIFFVFFISLNLLTATMTYKTHYTTRRSTIAKKTFFYFKENYPHPPTNQFFYFINDLKTQNQTWGGSKQIEFALEDNDFFNSFYQTQNKTYAYYQDTGKPATTSGVIKLKASLFLE